MILVGFRRIGFEFEIGRDHWTVRRSCDAIARSMSRKQWERQMDCFPEGFRRSVTAVFGRLNVVEGLKRTNQIAGFRRS
jgi:hypothetical protein